MISIIQLLHIVCLVWTVHSATSAYLKDEPSISAFSQKLLSFDTTIDKIPLVGLNLSATVFQKYGYTQRSLKRLPTILGSSNANVLLLDLFWNSKLNGWQLCPSGNYLSSDEKSETVIGHVIAQSPTCQFNFTLHDVLKKIPYHNDTSTQNSSATMKQLIFNLHPLQSSNNSNIQQFNITTNLSNALQDVFGPDLYRPSDYKLSYPSLQDFLFKQNKRFIAMIWQNDIHSSSYKLNEPSLFFRNNDPLPNSNKMFQYTYIESNQINPLAKNFSLYEYNKLNQQSWKFTVVSNTNSSVLRDIMLNGITTIVNDHTSNNTLLANISWAWAPGQPIDQKEARTLAEHNKYLFPEDQRAQIAYQCAVLYNGGWYVENCYKSHKVACQARENSLNWKITTNQKSYFEAAGSCSDSRTEHFNFSLPKTALIQSSLIHHLNKNNIKDPVWLDINDIADDNCWVSGGPDTLCPYTDVSENQRFIGIIIPISVFIIFVFSLILITSAQKVPIQKNRKYWKKLVADFTENEYEGVPA